MTALISDTTRAFGLSALKRAAGVVARRLPIPQPLLLVGPGASGRLGQAVVDFAHRKVLIVTDEVIAGLGLMKPLTDALAAAGTPFVIFDQVTPDAPIPVVEQGIAVFLAEGCDAIVAFGGGSVIDAAKVIGLAAANGKHPSELVGYFKGRHGPVPIYAVPTTAGTGSEVTVAAVISDPASQRKLVIADTRIVPRMAALDPCLMTGLPAHITAATGMDALTHAVEAYIGLWGSDFTDRMALAAVAMIYRHLPVAHANGQDLVAREKMALASTYAGLAFTHANVGNVHAIAHQLGGLYHTPHGLANAILLPAVLRFSASAIQGKLAAMALRAGLGREGDPEGRLAQAFLDSVEAMNRTLGIPRQLEALRESDIPELAKAACREADANYPVPRVMSRPEGEALLREVLAKNAPVRRAATKKPVKARAPARKVKKRVDD
ncbi:MAG: iron-containing alcohol dehydrogenase [Rubrivivax sp.]|nr:iron-containing alcohol dehydrogenase [Rubrivivax sp.]